MFLKSLFLSNSSPEYLFFPNRIRTRKESRGCLVWQKSCMHFESRGCLVWQKSCMHFAKPQFQLIREACFDGACVSSLSSKIIQQSKTIPQIVNCHHSSASGLLSLVWIRYVVHSTPLLAFTINHEKDDDSNDYKYPSQSSVLVCIIILSIRTMLPICFVAPRQIKGTSLYSISYVSYIATSDGQLTIPESFSFVSNLTATGYYCTTSFRHPNRIRTPPEHPVSEHRPYIHVNQCIA